MSAFTQALEVQGRVIWALSLREIQGMHGETRLGYLWQIIKIGFSIAAFWGVRAAMGAHFSDGLPLPIFLLTGFIPWYTFADLYKHCMEAARTNNSLLNFPQITLLDIQIGSSVLTIFTHVLLLLLFLILFIFMDVPWEVRNPAGLLWSFMALSAFGFGFGLILATLNSFFPSVEKLVPMVMRILFFVSGVFWTLRNLAATGILEILLWNPMLNYIELFRSCFVYREFPSSINYELFFFIATVTLALGLFCERSFRARLIAQ